jgi:hypothetical protein
MADLLGFAARICGTIYPAAIFSWSGKDGYCWPGDLPTNGTLIHFDLNSLEWQKFSGMRDVHESYHHSGQRHQKIGGTKVVERRGETVPNIPDWASLRSVMVPLIAPFPWAVVEGHPSLRTTMSPWLAVKPYILESHDFDGADGVRLHGYICRHERVDDLICKWRAATRHWTVGEQDLRLVVLLEPVAANGPMVRDQL